MVRSDAQKAADKRYAASNKGKYITWTTKLKPSEATVIDAIIASKNMTRADFLRWAAEVSKNEQGKV